MNRRNTVYVTANGIKKTLYEWAQETGTPYKVLQDRLFRYGWSAERAINTPRLSVGGAMRERWAQRKAAGITTHWRTEESYRRAKKKAAA